MGNPHDEEYQAEARRYVLWCEGRLEELRREGLVEGQPGLTEAGWVEYRSLVATGFVPAEEKVIWTLKSNPHVPAELAEQLAALVLTQRTSTNDPATRPQTDLSGAEELARPSAQGTGAERAAGEQQRDGFEVLLAGQRNSTPGHYFEETDGSHRTWQELSPEGRLRYIARDAAVCKVPFERFAAAVRDELRGLPAAEREQAALRLVLGAEQQIQELEALLGPDHDLFSTPLVDRFKERLVSPPGSENVKRVGLRHGAEQGESIAADVAPGVGWPAGITKRTCLESLESRYFTADIFLNPPNHYYPTDGPRSEVLVTRKDSYKETFIVDSDQGELADLASFAESLASMEREGAMLPTGDRRISSPNKHLSATVYPNDAATKAVLEFRDQTPGESRLEALHVFLFEAEDFHDLTARVAKRHAELRAEPRAELAKRAGPEKRQEQTGQEAPKTPPLYELKLAGVQANVQRNEAERGTFYGVSVFQNFSGHGGLEKVTSSIREQDIPAAVQLLQEAQRCIQAEHERTKGKEQQVQVTRDR